MLSFRTWHLRNGSFRDVRQHSIQENYEGLVWPNFVFVVYFRFHGRIVPAEACFRGGVYYLRRRSAVRRGTVSLIIGRKSIERQ